MGSSLKLKDFIAFEAIVLFVSFMYCSISSHFVAQTSFFFLIIFGFTYFYLCLYSLNSLKQFSYFHHSKYSGLFPLTFALNLRRKLAKCYVVHCPVDEVGLCAFRNSETDVEEMLKLHRMNNRSDTIKVTCFR